MINFKIPIVIFFITFITLIATGCETLSRYKVSYCDSTVDSVTKKAVLLAIRAQYPLYPEEGICIDPWEHI